MKEIIILVGIPGSGKTTYAKNLIDNKGGLNYVSRDKVRFEIIKEEDEYFSKENVVFSEFIRRIQSSIDRNESVIVDATNLSKPSRQKLITNLSFDKSAFKLKALVFTTNLQTCINRNSKREGRERVPEQAIKNMAKSFSIPKEEEGFDEVEIIRTESKIWVTSDTHFNHKNILLFESKVRDFSSVDEMNEVIINNWNKVVQPQDTIYILGDMFMGPLEGIDKIMVRLKGRKILIRGNHDTNPRLEKLKLYCEEIHDLYTLKHKGSTFVMCHYPIREWAEKEKGSIHLYGHIHGMEHRNGLSQEGNCFHVGVDTNNLTPVDLDSIADKFFRGCKHDGAKLQCTREQIVCSDCHKTIKKYNVNGEEKWY